MGVAKLRHWRYDGIIFHLISSRFVSSGRGKSKLAKTTELPYIFLHFSTNCPSSGTWLRCYLTILWISARLVRRKESMLAKIIELSYIFVHFPTSSSVYLERKCISPPNEINNTVWWLSLMLWKQLIEVYLCIWVVLIALDKPRHVAILSTSLLYFCSIYAWDWYIK